MCSQHVVTAMHATHTRHLRADQHRLLISSACNHYYCLLCLCTGSAMQAANLLLMDSVAGVGYSYSLSSSDYNTSDSQAQIDMEATLREWFRMYPFFTNNSVFLQGDTHAKLCKAAMTHDTQILHTISNHSSICTRPTTSGQKLPTCRTRSLPCSKLSRWLAMHCSGAKCRTCAFAYSSC